MDPEIKISDQKSKMVHLHCHSEYSSLDGGSKISDMPKKLKELGMASMALTDHGVMQGIPDFYTELRKEGIKPIIGLEAYMTENQADKKGQTWHITLLAENNTGYKNLCKISSWAFINGTIMTIGRPRARADWKLLEKYSEGIICLTGCMAGPVMNEIMIKGNLSEARRNVQRMIDIFGKENVYGELQNVGIVTAIPADSELAKKLNKKPLTAEEAATYESPHGDVSEEIVAGDVPISQTEANAEVVEICKEFGLAYTATGDVHYLNEEDALPHDAMICIGTGQIQGGKRRFSLLPKRYHMRSEEEMLEAVKIWPEALEESVRIADRCNVEIEWGKELLPRYPLPEGFDKSKDYLRHLCLQGIEERYPGGHKHREEAFERLDYELGVIDKMGYNDYFLIIWDFNHYANEQNIPTGPGRGSAAGAIVAYSLDITKIDPLEFGLLFERFLNPDRVSMPDVDFDSGVKKGKGREELIEYVREKYNSLAGIDTSVCQVVTFSKFKAKGALRDSARVLAEPTEEGRAEALKLGDRLAGMIPDDPKATMKSVWQDKQEGKQLRAAFARGGMEERVIKQAGWLEDLVRAYSTHAAAVIIADHDLTDDVPLQKLGDKKELETQYDMGYAEDTGLLKMDFLGLKTLDIIWDAVDKVNHVRGIKIDPYKDIPFDDEETYKMLADGKSIGTFQLESGGMQGTLQEIRPTVFNDLIAIVALYRPGSMGHILTYAARKRGDEEVSYIDPRLEKFLAETYGVVCIEENQKISMADGSLKPIKEIQRGEMVSSFDLEDNNKAVIEEVHGVRPTRFEKGLDISLGDGSKLTLTKDHKVLTSRGYIEAQYLDPEQDLVATPSYILTGENPLSLNQEWLGTDENLAYLLGQLTGDGSLSSNTITISTGKLENHQKLAEFIERNLNLVINEYFHCRSWYISLSNPELLNDKSYGNRKTRFHKMIEDFGMKQTCYEKTVPQPVLKSSSEVKASYLAGLFDADGNITKRGTLVLTSVSDELLDGVKALLLSLGITSKKKKDRLYISNSEKAKTFLSDKTLRINWDKVSPGQKDRTRLLLRSDFKKTVDDLRIPGRQFAKEYGVSRKTAQIKTQPFILEGISNKVSPHGGDLCYRTIESISETVEEKQFYGISVNRTHNFVCNFAVVKNCYQEQSMLISRELGGFTPGQADDLRKAIGKKLHDKMDALKDPYIKGCLENNISKKDAETLWADNEAAADYSFNKSHAACYAYLAYITAYLKANYPEEYMAALLSSAMGHKDKPRLYLTEAKRMGITVLPPDINRSLRDFAVQRSEDGKDLEILFGINAIKGVGEAVVENILEERKARGPFESIYDLIKRMPKLTKISVQSLIKSGALDIFGNSRKALFDSSEDLILEVRKKIKDEERDFVNKLKAELDGEITTNGLADEKKSGTKLNALGRKGVEAAAKAYNKDNDIKEEALKEEVLTGLRKEVIRAEKARLRQEVKEKGASVAGIASEEENEDEGQVIETKAEELATAKATELKAFADIICEKSVTGIKEIEAGGAEEEGLDNALQAEAGRITDNGEWPEAERLNIERQMLGVYVSGHPLEGDAKKWANYVTKGLSQIDADYIGTKQKVVGAIVDLQPIRTKAGKNMARLTVEDLTGSRDLIIFPDTFEGGPNQMLELGAVLYFGVSVDEDTFQNNKKDQEEATEEESSKPVRLTVNEFFRWDANKLEDPDIARSKIKIEPEDGKPVVIDIKGDQFKAAFVKGLQEVCKKNPGESPVHLQIDGKTKKTALTIDGRINLASELNELLES